MKNNRKRKLDILLARDVPEDKVKNVKQNVPDPMNIEETKRESESENEVEDKNDSPEESEDDQDQEESDEVKELEEKPDSEPEVIEFIDPIQLIKKKRAEQLAKRAKMT